MVAIRQRNAVTTRADPIQERPVLSAPCSASAESGSIPQDHTSHTFYVSVLLWMSDRVRMTDAMAGLREALYLQLMSSVAYLATDLHLIPTEHISTHEEGFTLQLGNSISSHFLQPPK